MKTAFKSLTLAAAILALAALAVLHRQPAPAAAAQGPTYTQAWSYLQFVGSNPNYSGNATATGAPVSTNFSGHYVNVADPTDTHDIAIGGANFDLLAPPYSTQTATYGGITATGAQIYGLLNVFATAQFAAQQSAAAAAKAAKAAPEKSNAIPIMLYRRS